MAATQVPPAPPAPRTDAPAEHILVCLSASPSNARIIRTAATMARAFGGAFTALYVQTPASETQTAADRRRLENVRQSAQAAFRTGILFDTNRLLQKADGDSAMLRITASQLLKLLERDIAAYPEENGGLGAPLVFAQDGTADGPLFTGPAEVEAAQWAFANNKYPPAKPGFFHRRVKPFVICGTRHVALVRSGSCKVCYLPPVSGLFRSSPSSTALLLGLPRAVSGCTPVSVLHSSPRCLRNIRGTKTPGSGIYISTPATFRISSGRSSLSGIP